MADPADRLRMATDRQAADPALTRVALQTLDSSGQSPADAVFAAARYLDTLDNEDGRHDRAILDALALLLERESSFSEEAEYLAAARALAEVALRRQRWTIANNALLVLDSRLPNERRPTWIRAYRTKLFFRLEPEVAFDEPSTTLGLLGPLGALDDQGVAVVREYLAQARDRHRGRADGNALGRFLEGAGLVLQPILPKLDDLWRQLHGEPEQPDEDDAETPLVAAPAAPTVMERRPTTPPTPKLPEEGEPVVPEAPSSAPAAGPPPEALQEEIDELRRRNAELEAEREQASALIHPDMAAADVAPTISGDTFSLGRRHLLVLGAVRPAHNLLQGIAKLYGVDKDQLVFETEYDKLTMYDLESLRYSHACAGVILGAVPHKMKGVGSASSAIELLRQGEGFPPSVAAYAGSELKVTKTSFRRALEELRDQLRANGAPTVRGGVGDLAIQA